MGRILIWRKPIQGSDIDIFHKTDYCRLYERTKELYGYTTGINFGNRVWFQGICSAIDRPGNQITYGTEESIDEINANYDLIIYPMANFFSERFCRDTTNIAKLFSELTIPVYIIACGAQAESYDRLDDLIKKIGDQARRFIDSIYHTGGEFALRGYFTKEFFAQLGYRSPVVTGCPSLFQIGPDLRVEKKERVCRRPIINGRIKRFEGILQAIPESVFVDQDTFLGCLYNPNYLGSGSGSLKNDIKFCSRYSIAQAKLLAEGRIHLVPDVPEWLYFLKQGDFDYSFGTKIHGSITPILAGIPATVISIDSRTREMAEFFDIPHLSLQRNHRYTVDDLLSSYEQADYSKFNSRFAERYHAYESFLREKGIVDEINAENHFLQGAFGLPHMEYQPNRQKFQQYANKLKREKVLLDIGLWARNLRQ